MPEPRFRVSQPGGRPPAPGGLGVVQSFINTRNIETAGEELPDAAALGAFLRLHGLLDARGEPEPAELAPALALREALRDWALANNDGTPLPAGARDAINASARRAGLVLQLDPRGEPVHAPTAAGIAGALGALLGIVFRALADGEWERLKACRQHGCRWAYYDTSRNRSSTWCTMATCGSREKMRAYRRRR